MIYLKVIDLTESSLHVFLKKSQLWHLLFMVSHKALCWDPIISIIY